MACVARWRQACLGVLGVLLFCLAMPLQAAPTPLEKAGFTRISRSAEISEYLQALAAQHSEARYEVLGKSVQGRPLDALVITHSAKTLADAGHLSASAPESGMAAPRLKIMIVGSQHGGAEPAGGEALLVMARDLLEGDLRQLLDHFDFVLIPNANPDGRDMERRSNVNSININTDFVLMSQPETQVLTMAVRQYQPDIVLDSHESAVLKRTTLAKEGYLTDFYAQFESANNPAIPAETRQFALNIILPQLVARVTRQGLPSHRYIGEITSIHQPITDGGLTLKNFRNMAGLNGALSFLVETRLDSRDETYPTYRNIRERVGRQLICLRAFLDTMSAHQAAIAAQLLQLREAMKIQPVALSARYVTDAQHPEIAIALRRLDNNELQTLIFPDHRKMVTDITMSLPHSLVITDHVPEMMRFLQAHQIAFQSLAESREVELVATRYHPGNPVAENFAPTASRHKCTRLSAGALWIDLSQPLGRLALLLLDPRSISSVFRYPAYSSMVSSRQDFFIYALP